MDNKETIIQATMELIEEKGARIEQITVRDICEKANVGLGLVNYYFENKDKLIELCVERLINGIVDVFRSMDKQTKELSPFERLEYLGNRTLTFLFDHYAVSKISIITDMRTPKQEDNTDGTYRAYLPLVAACRPDWDEVTVKRKTFCLIAAVQQMFLRCDVIRQTQGINLKDREARKSFHSQILKDILGYKMKIAVINDMEKHDVTYTLKEFFKPV